MKYEFTRFIAASAALLVLLAAQRGAVGTRTFELHKGDDFKGGDLKGVAVDSSGEVHAGFNLGHVPATDVASIWSALVQKDGSVLLGTGNDGKILVVRRRDHEGRGRNRRARRDVARRGLRRRRLRRHPARRRGVEVRGRQGARSSRSSRRRARLAARVRSEDQVALRRHRPGGQALSHRSAGQGAGLLRRARAAPDERRGGARRHRVRGRERQGEALQDDAARARDRALRLRPRPRCAPSP